MNILHCFFAAALCLGLAGIAFGDSASGSGSGSALVSDSLWNYSAGLPATDALGRRLPGNEEVGYVRRDRFVGLFYWTWHSNFAHMPARNVTEVLASHPDADGNTNHSAWAAEGTPYFWSEPLFGYYRNTDRWVLRRHAEMLADAGVDVIVFDCTNGAFTWKESYMALCQEFMNARRDGVNTPKIAFMLAFGPTPGSREAILEIYRDLYKPQLYKELWFYWKGKPLIMAYPEMVDPALAAEYAEVRNFFTFRPGQPLYNQGSQRPDHWGWLAVYPQAGFGKDAKGQFEQSTVGVAQNWSKERGLTAMNAPGTFGRSYTDAGGQRETPNAEAWGFNFQEQWERALKLDPEFLFITGWNEWIAGRHNLWQEQVNAFPDEFSPEKSRDIEPMKGGFGDAYYYQMVANIRRFKGVPAQEKASPERSIRIDGKFGDWAGVEPRFRAHRGSTLVRDSKGWGTLHYRDSTGRNDLVLARVARDSRFVYFYIEAAAPLTSPLERGWMRLLVDTDRNKATGWEGYDLIVNRELPGRKALVEKNLGGWNWHPLSSADFAVHGASLELALPRILFGERGPLRFEFKWSDNMQEEGNLTDFYLHGDVAPAGRFNFLFSE